MNDFQFCIRTKNVWRNPNMLIIKLMCLFWKCKSLEQFQYDFVSCLCYVYWNLEIKEPAIFRKTFPISLKYIYFIVMSFLYILIDFFNTQKFYFSESMHIYEFCTIVLKFSLFLLFVIHRDSVTVHHFLCFLKSVYKLLLTIELK